MKPWSGKVEEYYNHLCIYMYDYTRFFINTNRDQILLMTPEPVIHTMIPLPPQTVNVNHEIKNDLNHIVIIKNNVWLAYKNYTELISLILLPSYRHQILLVLILSPPMTVAWTTAMLILLQSRT